MSLTVPEALARSRRVALVCLTVVAVTSIVGVVLVRLRTGEVPVGLVGIASVCVTGLVGAVMAGVNVSGRDR